MNAAVQGVSRKGRLQRLSVQRALGAPSRAQAPRREHIARWARTAVRGELPVEVAFRLVDVEEGRALNRDYRGRDYATNVLTFAYGELAGGEGEPVLAGDIVLCVPVIVREAAEQGKSVQAHFAHMVVHGMLHLQGYDHEEAAEALAMEALEASLLSKLGYGDPYA